jgi:RimJ/RimL family protein N-acetyltransferase
VPSSSSTDSSPRVTLEPVAPRHADAVQRLAEDPAVTATTNLPEPYPPDGAAAWIRHVAPRHVAGDEYAFAVRNAAGSVVGVVGVVDVRAGEEAELGYWIGRPFWNRGYATAAVREALRFAFGEAGLRHVFARPLARNVPSRRVLENLGFAEGGTETHEHPKWTDDDLVVRYTLTRRAFNP